MFSNTSAKIQFTLGVLWTLALYTIASLCLLIAVNTTTMVATVPIVQEVSDIYTIRTPNSIILRFTSVTHSPELYVVNLVRSLREIRTDKITLLPSVAAVVDKGEMTLHVSGHMPALSNGVWQYQRAYTYRPNWSINEKIATYPPISFRVCEEIGTECRLGNTN